MEKVGRKTVPRTRWTPEVAAPAWSWSAASDPGDHVARDLDLDGPLRSAETPGNFGLPARMDQHALGDLPVGTEVMQLRARS